MLVTNHVLAGALIGRATARRPFLAFAAGVVSHFAMDACPHWGDKRPGTYDRFIHVARCDGCAGLAAMALGAGLSPGHSRRAVAAGMLGGAVVDADKPMVYFFGWNPFPRWLQEFHERIQNEAPHRMPHELAVGAGLLLAVAALVPRD